MFAWPVLVILLGQIIGAVVGLVAYAVTGNASAGTAVFSWCMCISLVLMLLEWLVLSLSEYREDWLINVPLVGLALPFAIMSHYRCITGASLPLANSVCLAFGVMASLTVLVGVAIKILDPRQREQRGGKHCES